MLCGYNLSIIPPYLRAGTSKILYYDISCLSGENDMWDEILMEHRGSWPSDFYSVLNFSPSFYSQFSSKKEWILKILFWFDWTSYTLGCKATQLMKLRLTMNDVEELPNIRVQTNFGVGMEFWPSSSSACQGYFSEAALMAGGPSRSTSPSFQCLD